jgi:hypothetical protein
MPSNPSTPQHPFRLPPGWLLSTSPKFTRISSRVIESQVRPASRKVELMRYWPDGRRGCPSSSQSVARSVKGGQDLTNLNIAQSTAQEQRLHRYLDIKCHSSSRDGQYFRRFCYTNNNGKGLAEVTRGLSLLTKHEALVCGAAESQPAHSPVV